MSYNWIQVTVKYVRYATAWHDGRKRHTGRRQSHTTDRRPRLERMGPGQRTGQIRVTAVPVYRFDRTNACGRTGTQVQQLLSVGLFVAPVPDVRDGVAGRWCVTDVA